MKTFSCFAYVIQVNGKFSVSFSRSLVRAKVCSSIKYSPTHMMVVLGRRQKKVFPCLTVQIEQKEIDCSDKGFSVNICVKVLEQSKVSAVAMWFWSFVINSDAWVNAPPNEEVLFAKWWNWITLMCLRREFSQKFRGKCGSEMLMRHFTGIHFFCCVNAAFVISKFTHYITLRRSEQWCKKKHPR